MEGESAPDLLTCGICESLIFKKEKESSHSRSNSNDGSDVETEEESSEVPLSILNMITTVFQYPFNQMSVNLESRLSSESPFVTCDSCHESVKDFHSRFLELRDLIRETSRLSSVLNQWSELIIHAAGIKMYAKEADSSQDPRMILKSEINYQDHEDRPEVPDESQCLFFSCAVCDKVFSTKRNLSRHISSRHQEETERKSDSSFSPSSERGDMLQENSDTDSDEESEKRTSFRCTQCPKTFEKRRALQKHISRSHSTHKLPCFECGKVFKLSDHLKRHIKKVHGKEKLRQYMETLDEQMSSDYYPTTNIENCALTTAEDTLNCNVLPSDSYFQEKPGDGNPIYNDKSRHVSNLADIASSFKHVVEMLTSAEDNLTASQAGAPNTNKSFKANKSFKKTEKTQGHQPNRPNAGTRTPKTVSIPQCRCTICDRKFPTVRYLTAHLSFRHREELNSKADKSLMSGNEDENGLYYGCAHCPRTFSTGVLLTKHLRGHSTVKFRCSECNKLFTRSDHLRRHKRIIHKIKEPKPHKNEEIVYQPVTIGNATTTTSLGGEWSTGMQTRIPVTPPSEIVSTSTGEVRENPQPVELLTSADEDFDSDNEVEFSELKSTGVKVEVQTHPKKDADPKPQCRCTVCDCKFPTTRELITHISSRHLENKKGKIKRRSIIESSDEEDENDKLPYYGCAECPKKFPSSNLLNKHFRCHSTVRLPCSVCGKTFTRSDHLKKHKRNVHETVKVVKPRKPREKKEETTEDKKTIVRICSVCGKSFHRKDYFQIHMRSHSDERPYQCAECGKAFRSKKTLYDHSILHKPEGERPSFPCSYCERVFIRQRSLKYHEMTHTGNFEKKFVCSFPDCGKAFRQGKHLRNHEQVHKPTKDFSCSLCGALFKWKHNLRHHMVKTHGQR